MAPSNQSASVNRPIFIGNSLIRLLACGERPSRRLRSLRPAGSVEADEQAVAGVASAVIVLVRDSAQSFLELPGVPGSQPDRPQHQQRVRFGGGDLFGEGTEARRGGVCIVVFQPASGALIVPFGAAADLAGAGLADQACIGEHLEVVGNVALIAAEHGGELADGGPPLAEGEQQPVTRRVAQGLELGGGRDLENFAEIVHSESVNYT
jgi:hypothetical protein